MQDQVGQSLNTITFGTLIAFCIKSPAITLWTFRVNTVNARIDHEEDRERRRNIEIQDARKRRLTLELSKGNPCMLHFLSVVHFHSLFSDYPISHILEEPLDNDNGNDQQGC